MAKVRNEDSKFSDLEGILKGDTIIDLLTSEFQMLKYIRSIFDNLPPPSYERHANLDIVHKKTKNHKYPMGKQWNNILVFSTTALPPQGGAFASWPQQRR